MKANIIIKRRAIMLVIGLSSYITVNAQQNPISNFYSFNNYLLNPAEAANQNLINGTASHRIQWQGIEGAPKSSFLGISGALNDKMGIGGKIMLDETDILKQFSASLSYAYQIRLNDKANLSFGLSGMLVQNTVGYNDAVIGNYADEVINGGAESGIAFDAEAGIRLNYQKFKFGIATAHLFESGVGYNLPENRGEGTFERVRQFSSYTSYDFKLSENFDLQPSVLVRTQGVSSFQYEANALGSWKETLHLGVGYRQEAGFIGRIGFQITDQFMAAYAYEIGLSGFTSNTNGSHEFMLAYKVKKKDKKKETIQEVVQTLPTTKEEEEIKEEIEIVEEKVVEEVAKVVEEVMVEEDTLVNSTPTIEEKVADEEALKNEFTNRSNMIRYAIQSSDETVSSEEERVINRAVELMNEYPNLKLSIEGHSCDRGSEELNYKLSAKRAERVMQLIASKGIDKSRLRAVGKGESEPLVQNRTESDRAVNRRVQLNFYQE